MHRIENSVFINKEDKFHSNGTFYSLVLELRIDKL